MRHPKAQSRQKRTNHSIAKGEVQEPQNKPSWAPLEEVLQFEPIAEINFLEEFFIRALELK